MQPIPFEFLAVDVGNVLTQICELQLRGGNYLSMQLANGGGAALTDFVLQIRTHPNGAFVNYIGGDDWNAQTLSYRASADAADNSVYRPDHCAAGKGAWAFVDVGDADAVRIFALCGTATVLSLRGQITRRP
jgi:hypothetical protein